MVMKWDPNKNYGCTGSVKHRGITSGSGKWKTGTVCIQNISGKWRLELYYDTSPGNHCISIEVNKSNIRNVICKAQLVITIKSGSDDLTIQFRPDTNGQVTKQMATLDELIKDICNGKLAPESQQNPSMVCVSGWQQNGMTTPSKQTPSKHGVAKDTHFTSVKKRMEEVSLFEDTDDENEFKENQNRGQVNRENSQKFLQNGLEKAAKSRSHLQQIETSGFYGSSASTPRTYGAFSLSSNLKRTPGMMPDPTPQKRPRLSDPINYTWNKSSTQSTGNTQPLAQAKSLQGFSNLGNTCYMNAILQSLFCLDTFSDDLLYSNSRVMKSLHSQSLYSALYKLLRSRSKTLPEHVRRDMLRNVKAAISTTAKRFSGYQQHDAHEFLGQVLDQLKEEVTKVSVSTPSPQREGSDVEYPNPTVQNFEMEVLHSITCLNCQEVVTKAEQFNDLSVDMPRCRKNGRISSIQNALDLFFLSETIEYTCEKCGNNKSEVSHKFTRIPRVLVLHLKRYSFDQSIINTKTAQSISITRFLSLQSHCEEETYPPHPVVLRPTDDYKTPDKSPVADDSIPRRRLHLGDSFRFRKTRPAEEDEKEDVATSTPNKKAKIFDLGEDHHIKADMPIMITDGPEEEDKDLARALELSLQEANDRTEHYVDETKESELQKVLEMSRAEMEQVPNFDHDYGKTIQNMSEEEQMRLAIEQSLLETSGVYHNTTLEGSDAVDGDHEAVLKSDYSGDVCAKTAQVPGDRRPDYSDDVSAKTGQVPGDGRPDYSDDVSTKTSQVPGDRRPDYSDDVSAKTSQVPGDRRPDYSDDVSAKTSRVPGDRRPDYSDDVSAKTAQVPGNGRPDYSDDVSAKTSRVPGDRRPDYSDDVSAKTAQVPGNGRPSDECRVNGDTNGVDVHTSTDHTDEHANITDRVGAEPITANTNCAKTEKTATVSSGKLLQKSPLCVRKSNKHQKMTSGQVSVTGKCSTLDRISEETDINSSKCVQEPACVDLTSPERCDSDVKSGLKCDSVETKHIRTCLFTEKEKVILNGTVSTNEIRSNVENSTETFCGKKKHLSLENSLSEKVIIPNFKPDPEITDVKTEETQTDLTHMHNGSSQPSGGDKGEVTLATDEEYAHLLCEDEEDFQLMLLEDKENTLPDPSEVPAGGPTGLDAPVEDHYPELPTVENDKGDLPYSYKLVSIVNHQGSTSVAGHYVTDVFDLKKGSWFSCDDSNVTKATEAEVRTKRERSGYIFFYLNKDIYDDLSDNYAIQNKKK